MKSRITKTWLVLSLLLLTALDCSAQKLQISRIQAKLFYNSTGTFSENVLAVDVDLWNSAFDSSYSTLVIVEFDGMPQYLETHRRIELTARYIPFDRVKGSRTRRQIETIRNGSENGKAYAAFWFTETGCNPVYLTARIVGRRQPRVKETIEFGCGE